MRQRVSVTDEVEEHLRTLIRSLGPNQRLPSEVQLCEETGAGRSTIREAIRTLEKEGLLFRRQGVGTFTVVNHGPVVGGLEVLRGIPNIIRAAGQEPRIVSTSIAVIHDVSDEVRGALGLEGDAAQVVYARQLYLSEDVPIILGDSFVPARLFPDPSLFCARLKEASERNLCLFDVLERHKVHVKYAVSDVEAVAAPDPVSGLLGVRSGHPLLLLKEVHYSGQGKPVIYSRDYIESARYRCVVIRRKI